ncbi:3-hydroxyisobutyrate dehydrogenase [Inquilinus sp.]|jgi:3-hydroxyisobutyrate dehydrogenase|uniref:3-hydroxyisobutyrate dehydrogenase n=1 Tax=Inquilinus sp. TaxID=1932117 RepID=UPI003783D936
MSLRIAFLGLGHMGRPMALNLVKAGHQVSGFDPVEAVRDAVIKEGIAAKPSIAAAVDDAQVVISMLPTGGHAREAYLGEHGVCASAPAGALLIDCSTIDVDSARLIAKEAASRGFAMVDAPVSGGTGGATAGTLTFMAGGPDAAFARAEPVLQAMGKTIVHTGGPGTGQAAKICNNMVLGISMIAVSEAFALADKLGLDRQKLFDVSSKSSGQCWSLTTYCPVPGPVPTSPANRDYKPGFTAAMMLKDLRLSQSAAQATGAATPLGAAAASLYTLFVNDGEQETDFSGIFKMISGE